MARSSVQRTFACAAWLASVVVAQALGPHEIALLVNANSPASREVANHYVKLRGVPLQNVIFLDTPVDFGGSNSVVSLEEFHRLVCAPVTNALHERRLQDHLLAWVYSAGFPTAVQADSLLSIHGVTFDRGRAVSADEAREAKRGSPLFRGPGSAGGPQGESLSLEQFAAALRTNMPLPSMTLGHTGAAGLSVREIVEGLRLAARSDGSRPEGAVNFVMSSDIRSTCRSWQVPGVAKELTAMGVRTIITTNQPDRSSPLIGVQMGTATLEKPPGLRLLPGSMAEHLTSFGAVFSNPDQSKITEWIRAGAAGSAGTVTEPFAMWPKFLHARFFVHYAAGCTLLESMSLSLAAPAQTFLLGDPLSRPYGRLRPLTLICLADDDTAIAGPADFVATEGIGAEARGLTLLFFLDGRVFLTDGNRAKVTIDTRALDEGWHELRVVDYSGGNVRQQNFARKWFCVKNRGDAVRIVSPASNAAIPAGQPVECKFEASGSPLGYTLFVQGRKLAESTNSAFTVDLTAAGPGPVSLQAVARHEKGPAASRPVQIELLAPAQ